MPLAVETASPSVPVGLGVADAVPLRVVHLSTSDGAGGAARAAFRLHSGLRRAGHDSRMLVYAKYNLDPAVQKVTYRKDLLSKMRRRIRRGQIQRDFAPYQGNLPARYELFSDDRAPEDGADLAAQIPDCDVINIHWVSKFLDYEGFFGYLARHRPGVPIVWRLADMGALTGGCHYDQGCGKFIAQCGACPELGSSVENDLSRQVWDRKRRSLAPFGPDGIHLVATSRWIAAEASRSSLFGRYPATIIPNGLDVTTFSPRDKGFSRDLFQIPRDATVVMFVADSLSHRRKGFAQLTEAVEGIRGIDNLVLVSVGGGRPNIQSHRGIHLGRLTEDRLLSMAYSAADVFVIPSLQESFGQTVIESMACGTPVVGFASGGIPDMVRPGQSGWLAPTGDVAALRSAIESALRNPDERKQMGQQCRQIVLNEYTWDVQARRYVELYRSLVAARATAP